MKLLNAILLTCIFAKPVASYSQNDTSISLAAAGSRPWATYLPNRGYYVAWDNLVVDAIHLRRVDLSGIPTNDTMSMINTIASLSPRTCANAHHVAVVWEDRLSNYISDFNTFIAGYIFNLDSLRSGTYAIYNDGYRDAIRDRPDVDFIDDTTLLVVWSGNGPLTISPQTGIYAQLYSTAGNFIGGNLLLTDHIQNGVNGTKPRVVAHAGSGHFIVTWVDNSMGSSRLFGRKFSSNGIAQAPSFLISDDSAMTDMYYYGVAHDTSGGFVISWIADRDTVSRIEWRWYDKNGLPSSDTKTVLGDSKLFDSGMDLSIDEQNRTVLVWDQKTPKGSKIFGQAFRADRSSLGKTFRVSSDTTANDEILPRVISQNNRVFTVWQSNGIKASSIDFSTIAFIRENVKNNVAAGTYELYPCYPNPFNPSTTITFRLVTSSKVKLSIYNLLGEELATLVNRLSVPGTHRFTWNGNDSRGSCLPTGFYFVKLSVGDRFTTQKILLLK